MEHPTAPAVTGILESALYVESLDRAAAFYRSLFAFDELFGDERLRALAVAGRQVLLLFARTAADQPSTLGSGVIPPHGGHGRQHVAFAVPAQSLEGWEARLREHGIPVEGRVSAPRGGTSIYFRDPDGHLLELATPGLWPVY